MFVAGSVPASSTVVAPNTDQPLGYHSTDGVVRIVQNPTAGSTIGGQIATDGCTYHFPGNNSGDDISAVTNGVFLVLWHIVGTAATGAYAPPTVTTGNNMQSGPNLIEGGSGASSPQSGYNGTGATTGNTSLTVIKIVAFKTPNPMAAGESKVVFGTAGTAWPTSVSAGDLFVIGLPQALTMLAKLEEEEEKEDEAPPSAAERAEYREEMMLKLLAQLVRQRKSKSDPKPEALDLLEDEDFEMEPKESKEKPKAPLAPKTPLRSLRA